MCAGVCAEHGGEISWVFSNGGMRDVSCIYNIAVLITPVPV